MNILKTIMLLLTGLSLIPTLVSAQNRTLGNTPNKEALISGYFMRNGARAERVIVYGTTQKGGIIYNENPKHTRRKLLPIAKLSGIWLFEPNDVTVAKNLYEARKYAEAIVAFQNIQVKYRPFRHLNNSYRQLALFYEMECHRKLKNYTELNTRLGLYLPDKLTRPAQLLQTKLYRLYDAVHKKDWPRLATMCEDYAKDPLTLGQRAQVAYCHGLAYEGLGKKNDALNAYAQAMTSDFTRSEIIARDSALNSLRIFSKDKQIKTAMRLWRTPEEKTNTSGYRKLGEANALVRLYEKTGLGAGVALPSKYKKFKKFTSDAMIERLSKRDDDFKEKEKEAKKAKAAAIKAAAAKKAAEAKKVKILKK